MRSGSRRLTFLVFFFEFPHNKQMKEFLIFFFCYLHPTAHEKVKQRCVELLKGLNCVGTNTQSLQRLPRNLAFVYFLWQFGTFSQENLFLPFAIAMLGERGRTHSREADSVIHVKFNQFAHQFHCQERLLVFDFADGFAFWLTTCERFLYTKRFAKCLILSVGVHRVGNHNGTDDHFEGQLTELRHDFATQFSAHEMQMFDLNLTNRIHCFRRSLKPKVRHSQHHIALDFARCQSRRTRPTSTKFLRSFWWSRGDARWSRANSPLAKWSVSSIN